MSLKKVLLCVIALAVLSAPPDMSLAAVQESERQLTAYDEITLKDAETRQRFLSEIESLFLNKYESLWLKEDMSAKLAAAVDRASAEIMGKSWVPDALQAAFSDDTQREIQKRIPEEFRNDYERFLQILGEYFADTYPDKLSVYAAALRSSRLSALANAPALRHFFEENVRRDNVRDIAKLRSTVSQDLGDRPKLDLSSMAAFAGAMIGREMLKGTLGRKALTILGSGIGKKFLTAATVATGVGAAVAAGWAMYDIGSFTMEVWKSPEKLREALSTHYEKYYREQCPKNDWQELRKGVREDLDQIQARMARYDEDNKAISASPYFRALTSNMNETQQQNFVDRLISVRPLDDSVSCSDLVDNFGEFIVKIKPENIGALRNILSHVDPLRARQWLSLAGDKYYALYRGFPQEIWDLYMPRVESLEVLNWLLRQPESVRDSLAQLPSETTLWIMKELPERYLAQLCQEGKNRTEIADEVERLKPLDKELRQPWQGKFIYWVRRIVSYLRIARELLRCIGSYLPIALWCLGGGIVIWLLHRVFHFF